jgi:hypothetical protein
MKKNLKIVKKSYQLNKIIKKNRKKIKINKKRRKKNSKIKE